MRGGILGLNFEHDVLERMKRRAERETDSQEAFNKFWLGVNYDRPPECCMYYYEDNEEGTVH